MSVLLWGGNVLDDIPVSSSVLFLLLEGMGYLLTTADTLSVSSEMKQKNNSFVHLNH